MSVIINRVYTRGGDSGQTRLAGGQSVDKTDPRIEAYGTLDELNACLGVVVEALAMEPDPSDAARLLGTRIRRIQNELFDVGGELATLAEDRHPQQAIIAPDHVARLEEEIDAVNADLPTLRSFVLPGGGMVSAHMHVARTVCRRAERRLVDLQRSDAQRDEVLQYVNRLSDWLFVMGRQAAIATGHGEVLWKPGGR